MADETKTIRWQPVPPRSLQIIGAILLLMAVAYLGALTRNAFRQYDYIGRTSEQIYTITVNGEGKVSAVPDIGQVSLGIKTSNAKVEIARQENVTKMNALIAAVKALGVDSKDITTTQYAINPQYDWVEGRQILRGYDINQAVSVKIRALDKIGAVLDAAGKAGANQIGGLNFTIDEPEVLRQQAREKALQNATDKAAALAKIGNVKLGKLVSFSEAGGSTPPLFYERTMMLKAEADQASGAVPTMEPGSQDIISNVTVTYEVL